MSPGPVWLVGRTPTTTQAMSRLSNTSTTSFRRGSPQGSPLAQLERADVRNVDAIVRIARNIDPRFARASVAGAIPPPAPPPPLRSKPRSIADLFLHASSATVSTGPPLSAAMPAKNAGLPPAPSGIRRRHRGEQGFQRRSGSCRSMQRFIEPRRGYARKACRQRGRVLPAGCHQLLGREARTGRGPP